MYLFKEYVEQRFMEAEIPPIPPEVRPEDWANDSWRKFWLMGNPNYLKSLQPAQKPGFTIGQRPAAFGQKAVARALGPVQGQTGQGLESIPAGGRVPSHLVSQIPSGDIAPSWYTAVKYYKGKDGRIYRK